MKCRITSNFFANASDLHNTEGLEVIVNLTAIHTDLAGQLSRN